MATKRLFLQKFLHSGTCYLAISIEATPKAITKVKDRKLPVGHNHRSTISNVVSPVLCAPSNFAALIRQSPSNPGDRHHRFSALVILEVCKKLTLSPYPTLA